ncbi:MAG TPA: glycosyltransferase [Candidatus Saccharimonadales bacterium]|nr:glycosyltransferase [Candidatus Saccharimonadales bacterium]
MKVAIVHDWLIGGGAERVVYELHQLFPDAPIYTSYATDEWRDKLDGKVVTGYLQHFPRLRKYLPVLRAHWFSHLNLDSYDLIISSSGAEAKGVCVKKPAVHINYCHAPTHYYWDRYDDYLKSPGFPLGLNWLGRFGLKLLVGPMRRWDYKAAQRPDFMIANSTHTKAKIKQYYGRDSVVIHPPVDTARFAHTTNQQRAGFVTAGRQTPYKRIDLAVAACTELSLPLTVIGDGPDHHKLVTMAGPTIRFITDASDGQVAEHLAAAKAFVFPGVDDFGITAVEALAAGTPVIAYKGGGALDYVTEGKTGMFFDEQSAECLASCLKNFKSSAFDSGIIKQQAEMFSVHNFPMNIEHFIKSLGDFHG